MNSQAITYDNVTVVIPAKNEATALANVLPEIFHHAPGVSVIVVNDGSTDNTAEVSEAAGARVITHPYSLGNGAAIKSGARAVETDYVIFMDADGQHQPKEIPRFVEAMKEGCDMVVGARDSAGQASVFRWAANTFYNRFASYMTSQKIEDLTSGFRMAKTDRFREFLSLLPNGFSYPTTSTMAFFRAGYIVRFLPIEVLKREGKSHINLVKDGVRFLLIIFKIGTLYSPLKIFFPVAVLHFLVGVGYYSYTFMTMGRFTNMSALLFIASIMIMLMGLISEQITTLMYKDTSR